MFDLFIMESCPYCRKVMNYLNENGIPFHKFDITNSDNEKMLLALGGKDQVPFLHDEENDVKMYESDDIIKYASNLK